MNNTGGHHMTFFGLHFGWSFWAIVVMAVVVIAAILIHKESTKKISKSALDILKERYAKGKISKEEYNEKKKDLES